MVMVVVRAVVVQLVWSVDFEGWGGYFGDRSVDAVDGAGRGCRCWGLGIGGGSWFCHGEVWEDGNLIIWCLLGGVTMFGIWGSLDGASRDLECGLHVISNWSKKQNEQILAT